MNSTPTVHQIRKYPNRRYYDITTSKHMTLDDLYEAVRAGDSIVVTDSHTGGDITSLVLTQMILEREAPKLDMFPAGLLHQVIQSNQQILQSFVQNYFAGALNAFLQNQSRFGEWFQRAGMPAANVDPFAWARNFIPGARPAVAAGSATTPPVDEVPPPDPHDPIHSLQAQVAALSEQLQKMQNGQNNATAQKPRIRKPRRQ